MKILVLKTVEGYYFESKIGGNMCRISCCGRSEQRYSPLSSETQSQVSRWNITKKVALAVAGVFFAAGVIAFGVVINQSGPSYHTNSELLIGGGFFAGAALSTLLAACADGRENRARARSISQVPPEA